MFELSYKSDFITSEIKFIGLKCFTVCLQLIHLTINSVDLLVYLDFKHNSLHAGFCLYQCIDLESWVWKNGRRVPDGERGGCTDCQRRHCNRVDYGIWFTVTPGGVRGYKSL